MTLQASLTAGRHPLWSTQDQGKQVGRAKKYHRTPQAALDSVPLIGQSTQDRSCQPAAIVGHVIEADARRALASVAFAFDPLGEIPIRGKAETVSVLTVRAAVETS